jgi:hypothetical protein
MSEKEMTMKTVKPTRWLLGGIPVENLDRDELIQAVEDLCDRVQNLMTYEAIEDRAVGYAQRMTRETRAMPRSGRAS